MSEIYEIQKNYIFGRYMVAKRNIKQGELILKESPIFIGTQLNGPPICFKCCKILAIPLQELKFCPKCQVGLVCKKDCTGTFHAIQECETLQKIGLKKHEILNNLQILTTARFILLRNYSPQVWDEFLQLEPHLTERRNTPIWLQYQNSIERVLTLLKCLSKDDLKNELVQKVCGILDVNTFEIRPQEVDGPFDINGGFFLRGLYPKAALMSHSCVSNTHLAIDDDFFIYIHASVDIPKGKAVFFNYTNVLQNTLQRKEHLKEGKYFQCFCERCKDPKELGTNMSSILCPKCRNVIVPILNQKNVYEWSCLGCAKHFNSSLMDRTITVANDMIENTDPFDVRALEKLLKKLLLTFHPNHYLILEVKQNLAGVYSQSNPSEINLQRKIELCTSIMDVFQKVENGISRLQGITLYELHVSQVTLANKKFNSKEISGEEFVRKLLQAETTLKLAIKNLLYEPKKSPEGRLAQKALQELKILRFSMVDIEQELVKDLEKTNKKRNKKNLNKTKK